MDRYNAVWSGHIVAPFWIPHLPIFGKKMTPGPLGPKKGSKWPVCSPRRDGRFGTFGSIFRLFDFVRVTLRRSKKPCSHPTVRAPSASNSPCALSARAGWNVLHQIYLAFWVENNLQPLGFSLQVTGSPRDLSNNLGHHQIWAISFRSKSSNKSLVVYSI